MKLRIKNTKLTLQIIGWMQLIGGLIGFILIAYLMIKTGDINGAVLLIFFIGILLFSYSTYCGKKLLFDEAKKNAIIYSIINQFLQLIQWNILGCGLTYTFAAAITIGIGNTFLSFSFEASITQFKMSINSNDEFFLKLNLFALLVIVILFDILKELKREKNGIPENIETIETDES